MAVIMDPPHRCLISHTPPNRLEQWRAPNWNPLAKLSNHRSGGWKKDLDVYMGAYFRLNYRQEPASKWPELKAKFFNFLIDHHSEWKSIRNNDPLGYLQYMEVQFERVTGYRLVGLGACMEWIRAGTYYHWVIAQQGQLGLCPRLAGIPPPEGPMTPPLYPPGSTGGPASNCSPASNGGGLHTGYHPKSPTGRGRTTPSKVPATKKGCRCRRCPRHRPGYGRCWGLLRSEWQSNI